MMLASLNSLKRSVPAQLVVELLDAGVWETERALQFARGSSDESTAIVGITRVLAEKGLLDDDAVCQHIMSLGLEISDPFWRAVTLYEQADFLQGEWKASANSSSFAAVQSVLSGDAFDNLIYAIQIMFDTGSSIEGPERFQVYQKHFETWLSESIEFYEPAECIKLLGDALSILPELAIKDFITVANDLTDKGNRLVAFEAIAPHVSDKQQQLLAELAPIGSEEWARVLIAQATSDEKSDRVSRDSIDAVLEVAATVDNERRARLLVGIAQFLAEREANRAFESARGIEDSDHRARALVVLALAISWDRAKPILEDLQVNPALENTPWAGEGSHDAASQRSRERDNALRPRTRELMRALHTIFDDTTRESAAAELLGNMSDEELSEAFHETRGMNALRQRTLLVAISSILPDSLLEDMLGAIEALIDPAEGRFWASQESTAAEILGIIAPRLSPHLLARAIHIAAGLPSDEWRADALTSIIALLSDDQVPHALQAVRSIKDGTMRAMPLISLAERYDGDHRIGLLSEAPMVVGDQGQVLLGLTGLLPFLPSRSMSQLVEYVDEQQRVRVRDENWMHTALGLIPFTNDPAARTRLAAEIIESARGPVPDPVMSTEWWQAVSLGRLVKHLDDPSRSDMALLAIDAAAASDWELWEEHGIEALEALAPFMDAARATDALSAPMSLEPSDIEARAYLALAERLPSDDQYAMVGVRILTLLTKHHSADTLLRHWNAENMRRFVDNALDQEAGFTAVALTPLLSYMSPSVAKDVAPGLLGLALAKSTDPTEESEQPLTAYDRVKGLGGVLDYLEGDDLNRAVSFAERLSDELDQESAGRRANALIAVAEWIPRLRKRALEAVWEIEGLRDQQVELLSTFVSYAAPDENLIALPDALRAAMKEGPHDGSMLISTLRDAVRVQPPPAQTDLLRDALQELTNHTREEATKEVEVLVSVFSDTEMLRAEDFVDAIKISTSWWP